MRLSGFDNITPLSGRKYCTLSRAFSVEHGGHCVLMAPVEAFQPAGAADLLKRELVISRELKGGGLRELTLLEDHDSPLLILEDFPGTPVSSHADFLKKDTRLFLRAAAAVAGALAHVHGSGIVHRSIDGRSILLSGAQEPRNEYAALFTFFALSMKSGTDNPDLIKHHDCLSWEYAAPEITGLSDAPTDHRCDLYSLGMLFYETLTGSLPFPAGSRADIAHWHMTQVPPPPHEVNPTVPVALSGIVMVLLEKYPNKRYADAESLKQDLLTCLDRVTASGIIRGFTPAPSAWPIFPERLFGRGKETYYLLNTLQKTREGASPFTLIAGGPGIGKTALVRELIPRVGEYGGWYSSGKFDQYRHDLPYAALADALRFLVKQLLMCDKKELASWKKRIVSALRPNTGLIAGIVPELEHITGPCEPVPPTDPVNEANRFNRCVREFLAVLAGQSAPLVLFLDDLHWVDAGSLRTLRHMVETDPVPGLWLIGAYRDNEIVPDHLLEGLLGNASPGTIESLAPLDAETVGEIIQKTFEGEIKQCARLSALVFRKTEGNPFFVKRFLQSLITAGHLFRDRDGTWTWKTDAADIPVTENVADLLTVRMRMLPVEQRSVLTAAACAGNGFTSEFLSKVTDTNPAVITRNLLRLAKQDYLSVEPGGHFIFVHDKIQEAAYGMLSPKERKKLHRAMGAMLLRIHGNGASVPVFDIAGHLNRGRHAVPGGEEASLLVDINCEAGLRAKSSAAFDSAVHYFATAIQAAGDSPEPMEREMLYFLHQHHAECLYLNGKLDEVEQAVQRAMGYAETAVEKARLYNIIILKTTFELKFDEAINAGKTAAGLLGFDIALDPLTQSEKIGRVKKRIDVYLENTSVETILSLPECKSDDIRWLITIIRNTATSGLMLAQVPFITLMTAQITLLSFKYGLSPESTCGFGAFGQVLPYVFGEYELGEVFGRASYLLSKRNANPFQICEMSMRYGSVIRHWSAHLRESLDYLREGVAQGLKAGDYTYAGFATAHIALNTIALGIPIPETLSTIGSLINSAKKINDHMTTAILVSLDKVYTYYIGDRNEDLFLDYPENDPYYKNISGIGTMLPATQYCAHKALALYISGEFLHSYEYIKISEPYAVFFFTTFHEIDIYFFKSLIQCALAPEASTKDRKNYIGQAEELAKKLKEWAAQCPDNFLYRRLFLETELARTKDDTLSAMELYDGAIAAAREYGYLQFEAIICERAAGFWSGLGKEDFAELYLRRSYECYRRWGAVRKLDMMRELHPVLAEGDMDNPDSLNDADIASLLCMFNSFSSKHEMEGLTGEIARTLLLHTGAGRLAMAIPHGNRQFLQVLEASSAGPAAVRMIPDGEIEDDGDIPFPVEMARYMENTGESLIRYDGSGPFDEVPYMKKHRPRSALCVKTDTPGGPAVLYLENALTPGAFAGVKKRVLDLLVRQASLCMENTRYRAAHAEGAPSTFIEIRCGREIRRLPYADILYASSRGRNSVLHTRGDRYTITKQLNHLENELPSDHFLRVHRRYIVNRACLSGIQKDASGRSAIILDDKSTRIPVGRTYAGALTRVLEG